MLLPWLGVLRLSWLQDVTSLFNSSHPSADQLLVPCLMPANTSTAYPLLAHFITIIWMFHQSPMPPLTAFHLLTDFPSADQLLVPCLMPANTSTAYPLLAHFITIIWMFHQSPMPPSTAFHLLTDPMNCMCHLRHLLVSPHRHLAKALTLRNIALFGNVQIEEDLCSTMLKPIRALILVMSVS